MIRMIEGGYVVCCDGTVYSPFGRRLKPRVNTNGYVLVSLGRKSVRLHRVLAEAFIPNPENKRCVNHIDGVKTNNALDNLEWVTHSENQQHAYDNGLTDAVRGEKNFHAKLSADQVREICRGYPTRKYGWAKATCGQYGISRNTLYAIVNGGRYAEAQAI